MIHQPSGGLGGTSADMEIQMDEMLKIRQLGAEILAKNCGKFVEQILQNSNRDYWMSANEAVTYGIVDGKLDRL